MSTNLYAHKRTIITDFQSHFGKSNYKDISFMSGANIVAHPLNTVVYAFTGERVTRPVEKNTKNGW